MSIAVIILIALGLAMDAFAVSVSCGLCILHQRYLNALKVGFLFGFLSVGNAVAGMVCRVFLSGT